ncbi:uncharacterized protein BDZ99DRAFT_516186 [Mytilinidion resinicola]|uniref:Uncharacterized protein n=1 Tax=Mytilinidion resinicola TaxID=574789 RepID=A0A6A6Z2Y4_9PEZI|nr:uncharacterized protein BDZ99DRAFT_516186 [Mytilinidion resinicola]KAF2815466.1 hypothetical protein BDZ99DRAFT_516186 [Mytilinidion resinicola]
MDFPSSSADLRAPSIPTQRQHARTAKLGSAAQVAFAMSDLPSPEVSQSKRGTYTHLAAFIRPDAGKPKDRRGSTGLFMRRHAQGKHGLDDMLGDEGVREARWAQREADMDVEDAVWARACEAESESEAGGQGMSMEDLAGERREGGYGGLVERAVSANQERLRKRLEGDGWEFVGGRYGEGEELGVESEGSEVDEEFDVVVVCVV